MFIIRLLLPAFAGAASHDVDLLAAERAGVLAWLFERLARQRPIAKWAGEGKELTSNGDKSRYSRQKPNDRVSPKLQHEQHRLKCYNAC